MSRKNVNHFTLSSHSALRQLEARCNASFDDYAKLGTVKDSPRGRYIHIDNGGKVLAVAHLDTVRHDTHFIVHREGARTLVFSSRLDDRLGAFLVLDYLPQLVGAPFDVLLTEGEERGQSTALYYDDPAKDYNWIFQFDRQGTDVVMYQYETLRHVGLLEKYGFNVGFGSYSDICDLEQLMLVGFNFGCGYHRQHTVECYADLSETEKMTARFVKFYGEQGGVKMAHAPAPRYTSRATSVKFDWDDWRNLSGRKGKQTRGPGKQSRNLPEYAKVKTLTCAYCGRREFEEMGGRDEHDDFLCRDCNNDYMNLWIERDWKRREGIPTYDPTSDTWTPGF